MKILTVSELTQEIKNQLEKNLGLVSVKGEVINLKVQSSGHVYFTLKDAGAQVSAVLFKGASKGITKLPKEGDQIVIKGEITVYAPRGSYQILVREIQYQGVGELLAKLHELKNRLAAEGCFAKERKKKLPPYPTTIGVVTSPTGAVIQDIIQILQRRHGGFHLILYPVRVQGDGAKEEIAKAIDDFNRHKLADVLIVGRGGGSLEDLWAFNEEVVVRAILRSEIPIISAVGHETDVSLADFAADIRAPTPSAAAELVLKEKEQQLQFLTQAKSRTSQQALSLLLRLRQQLGSLKKNPYIASPYLLLARRMQQLDDLKSQMQLAATSFLKQKRLHLLSLEKQKNSLEPSLQIRQQKEKLEKISKALRGGLVHNLQTKKESLRPEILYKKLLTSLARSLQKKQGDLQKLSAHLTSIDPKTLLTKGYCILFAQDERTIVRSIQELEVEEPLKILLQDGSVSTKVLEITAQKIL